MLSVSKLVSRRLKKTKLYKNNYSTKGFRLEKFIIEFMDENFLSDLSFNERTLLYILHELEYEGYSDKFGYVRIPSASIKIIFDYKSYSASIYKLNKLYFSRSPYSEDLGIVFGYQLTSEFYSQLEEAEAMIPVVSSSSSTTKKNKWLVKKRKKSDKTYKDISDHEKRVPSDLVETMKCLEKNWVNIDLLHRLKYEMYKDSMMCTSDFHYECLYPNLTNDTNKVLDLAERYKIDDYGYFSSFYSVSSSGRIYGGTQGFRREVKAVAYKGCLNFDLVASQLNGMIYYAGELGLSLPNITNLARDPVARDNFYNTSDLEKDDMKKVLYAMLFGADLSKDKIAVSAANKIVSKLKKTQNNTENKEVFHKRYLNVISKAVEPYVDEFRTFFNAVQYRYKEFSTIQTNRSGIRFLTNSLGMTFPLDGFATKVFKNKQRILLKDETGIERINSNVVGNLSAFFLQGLEGSIINNIIRKLTNEGFTVLQQEHDGFIVDRTSDKIRLKSIIRDEIDLANLIYSPGNPIFDVVEKKIGEDIMELF